MEYKKILKKRLCYSIGWMIMGLIMAIVWFVTDTENTFLFSFGIALVTIGVIRIIQYRKTTKDETSLRQKQLQETDERNRMLAEKARSWAFSFYILLAGIGVILCSLLGHMDAVQPLARSVCLLAVLYWLSYLILNKKY